jgi:hypothetical protein
MVSVWTGWYCKLASPTRWVRQRQRNLGQQQLLFRYPLRLMDVLSARYPAPVKPHQIVRDHAHSPQTAFCKGETPFKAVTGSCCHHNRSPFATGLYSRRTRRPYVATSPVALRRHSGVKAPASQLTATSSYVNLVAVSLNGAARSKVWRTVQAEQTPRAGSLQHAHIDQVFNGFTRTLRGPQRQHRTCRHFGRCGYHPPGCARPSVTPAVR